MNVRGVNNPTADPQSGNAAEAKKRQNETDAWRKHAYAEFIASKREQQTGFAEEWIPLGHLSDHQIQREMENAGPGTVMKSKSRVALGPGSYIRPSGKEVMHIFADEKTGELQIKIDPPPEIGLKLPTWLGGGTVFTRTGAMLGRMTRREDERPTGFMKPVFDPKVIPFAVAAVVFPPLALASVLVLPFAMQNDYSQWLANKNTEIQGHQAIGRDKIEIEATGPINVKQLNRLIKLAERNEVGFKLGPKLTQQLTSSHEFLGRTKKWTYPNGETRRIPLIDYYEKRRQQLEAKRYLNELLLDIDDENLLEKMSKHLDDKTKLSTQFPDEDLDPERRDALKNQVLNNEMEPAEKVQAISNELDAMQARMDSLQEARELTSRVESSLGKLMDQPELLLQDLTPKQKKKFSDNFKFRFNQKRENLAKNPAEIVNMLDDKHQKINPALSTLLTARKEERQDLENRLHVWKEELAAQKEGLAQHPGHPEGQALLKGINEQLKKIKAIEGGLKEEKVDYDKVKDRLVNPNPDSLSTKMTALQGKLQQGQLTPAGAPPRSSTAAPRGP